MIEGNWSACSDCPPLLANDVHLWRLALDHTENTQVQQLWSLLSGDEQARAQRFVRPEDQRRFVQVRGTLRWLLAQYLDRDPVGLTFAYGPKGKPQLAQVSPSLDVQFNLSHSDGWAVFALTLGRAIGVDVERIKSTVDCLGIAQRFFQVQELQALQAIAPEHRCQRFFQIWTRKEAVIKAMGSSIAVHLEQIDVSIRLDQAHAVVQVPTQMGQPQAWMVYEVPIQVGYQSGFAIANPPHTIHTYSVPPWPNGYSRRHIR